MIVTVRKRNLLTDSSTTLKKINVLHVLLWIPNLPVRLPSAVNTIVVLGRWGENLNQFECFC